MERRPDQYLKIGVMVSLAVSREGNDTTPARRSARHDVPIAEGLRELLRQAQEIL